jgi:hypothetical protein
MQNVEEGVERGAQFVAYIKGRKVLDLVGSQGSENHAYTQSSVQVIMSSTKNMTALGASSSQPTKGRHIAMGRHIVL